MVGEKINYNGTWSHSAYNKQTEVKTAKMQTLNNRLVLLCTKQVALFWGSGYGLIACEHDHHSEPYKEFSFVSIDLLVLNTPKTVLWIKTPSWRARDWVSVIVSQALPPLSRKCLAHMLSRAHDIKKHLSTSTLWQMYVLHAISPSIQQQIWMASPTEK